MYTHVATYLYAMYQVIVPHTPSLSLSVQVDQLPQLLQDCNLANLFIFHSALFLLHQDFMFFCASPGMPCFSSLHSSA